jgi:hypothetical protein
MQKLSNQTRGASLAENRVVQLILSHGPDFVFFFNADLLKVFFTVYFLQTESLLAAQRNIFYESLKKARRRRHF